jgi:Domain of unknown function (DUF397)
VHYLEEVRGMTVTDLSRAEWRKSSYSSQDGNCVEVARNLPRLVAVRDSKHPDVGRLVVSCEAWQIFMKKVRG